MIVGLWPVGSGRADLPIRPVAQDKPGCHQSSEVSTRVYSKNINLFFELPIFYVIFEGFAEFLGIVHSNKPQDGSDGFSYHLFKTLKGIILQQTTLFVWNVFYYLTEILKFIRLKSGNIQIKPKLCGFDVGVLCVSWPLSVKNEYNWKNQPLP